MMYRGTKIQIVDNTGVKIVKCLQTYKHRDTIIGDPILVILYKYKKLRASVVRKKLYSCRIATIRTKIYRKSGDYFIRFSNTTGFIVSSSDPMKILGTRISIPMTKEFRQVIRLRKLSPILI